MKRLCLVTVCLFFMVCVGVLAQQKKISANTNVQKGPDPLSASIARGKIVYQKECLSCHQADGTGVPNMNPTLVKTSWVLGKKQPLIELVLKGSFNKVEIDGETFHNVMAPHNHLTDREIADVLTYIRNSFGNKVVAVNAAEVKAIRAKLK